MPQEQTFVIRRTFLLPLGLLLLLTIALLVTCLIQGQPVAKAVILVFIILPVAGFFVESVFRRVAVDEEGATVYKLLRKKHLSFVALTSVETVMVRKRVFLTLCADDDFVIISNAYADFPGLVAALLQRISETVVSDETRKMAEAPPIKSTDIISCWLATALVAFILYIQFTGHS